MKLVKILIHQQQKSYLSRWWWIRHIELCKKIETSIVKYSHHVMEQCTTQGDSRIYTHIQIPMICALKPGSRW